MYLDDLTLEIIALLCCMPVWGYDGLRLCDQIQICAQSAFRISLQRGTPLISRCLFLRSALQLWSVNTRKHAM